MKKQRQVLDRYNMLHDNTTENLKQNKINSLAFVDQATDGSSSPNQLKEELKVGAIMEFDARTTGVQFKSAA